MDIDLLHQAYGWTAERIAAVDPAGLDTPTPCGRWELRDLLDHTVGVLTIITEAVDPTASIGPGEWGERMDAIAERRPAWSAPGLADQVFELPFATMPGSVLAIVGVLESVVHGWDIGQATGENVEIPDHFAFPVLAFARGAIADGDRGDNFAADLGLDGSPSDQLVAFLGRKPR